MTKKSEIPSAQDLRALRYQEEVREGLRHFAQSQINHFYKTIPWYRRDT